MAIVWEGAAHSADHMFSLFDVYYLVFVILLISCFGFEDRIWILFAPVPGHCLIVTVSALLS